MTDQKTILIADDDQQLVHALALRCEAMGLKVRKAYNGVDAILQTFDELPDLIVLDVCMPDADGLNVYKKLSHMKDFHSIPVVFLTGAADDETVRKCEAVGAEYIVKGDEAWGALKLVIRQALLLGKRPQSTPTEENAPVAYNPQAPTILAIDDDRDILRALKTRFRAAGANYFEASNPQDGFALALKERPDVIISDYMMPEASGLYLIQRLRNSAVTRSIPVIIITGETFDESRDDIALQRRLCSQEGVVAYLQKPVAFDELHRILTNNLNLALTPFKDAARSGRFRRPQPVGAVKKFGRRTG